MRRRAENLHAATRQVKDEQRAVGDEAFGRPDLGGIEVGARDGAPVGVEERLPGRGPPGHRRDAVRLENASDHRAPHAMPQDLQGAPEFGCSLRSDSPVPCPRPASESLAARQRAYAFGAERSTSAPRGAGASAESCPTSRWSPTPADGRGPDDGRGRQDGGAGRPRVEAAGGRVGPAACGSPAAGR